MKKLFLAVTLIGAGLVGLYTISQQASPASKLFYVKRMGEIFILATRVSPESRARYYAQLLEERLSDIKQINQEKQYDLIISASLRHSTVAGRLTETVKNNQLTDMSSEIREQFASHKQVLQEMADSYSEKDDRWKFMIDAVNYLAIYEKELP